MLGFSFLLSCLDKETFNLRIISDVLVLRRSVYHYTTEDLHTIPLPYIRAMILPYHADLFWIQIGLKKYILTIKDSTEIEQT